MAGRNTLHSLAHAAVALQVVRVQDFYQAILAMEQRKRVLEEEREQLAQQRHDLLKREEDVDAMLEATKAAVHTAEKEERGGLMQRQRQELGYYEKKKAEYEEQLQQCQKLLEKVQFDPSVRHQQCVVLFEELKAVQEACGPLENDLQQFYDLEPTVAEAKAKVEAAKAELALLKTQYSALLAEIANAQ